MPPSHFFALNRLNAALWLALASTAHAQTLQEVVVSASRQEQQSFDAPASIQAVGQDVIEAAGPRVNLSESLNRVPGITVLNRQNYAQDLQLSIRGSGSRSPFGIRGARLIVDGIPATMPDGQGQASTISLPSAQRIEVLRGPLAQLYGNSAGGVVQVFTADGPARPELRLSVDLGSDGLQRYGVQAAGQSGAVNYVVDVSDFQTDGWRTHSAAERQHLNAKLRWDASDQTRVTLVANVFDQPVSGDPLGLTRADAEADPRQAVAASTQFISCASCCTRGSFRGGVPADWCNDAGRSRGRRPCRPTECTFPTRRRCRRGRPSGRRSGRLRRHWNACRRIHGLPLPSPCALPPPCVRPQPPPTP